MDGWWCVRYSNALAWVEAPTEAEAVRRSLGLHSLGDWTDDARELVVSPQDAYPDTELSPTLFPPSVSLPDRLGFQQ